MTVKELEKILSKIEDKNTDIFAAIILDDGHIDSAVLAEYEEGNILYLTDSTEELKYYLEEEDDEKPNKIAEVK